VLQLCTVHDKDLQCCLQLLQSNVIVLQLCTVHGKDL
jgi:hypothetical protein